MNNQSNLNITQKAQKLSVDAQNDLVLSNFWQSVELVGGNVFYLFIGKSVSSVINKVTRVETRADSLKRKIIYIAKGLNCDSLLDFMDTLTSEDIKGVGMDFLCITAKKISKNHSIENFSRFLKSIFLKTGFENGLIKIFLFSDRDINELSVFLDNVKEWADQSMFGKVVISILDHLGSVGYIDRMAQVISKYGDFAKSQADNSKLIQRVTNHFFQNAIQNSFSTESIISMLKKLVNLGFKINYSVFNKMLDMVNKSGRKDNLMECLVKYMEELNIEFNLITYNCILDYYCSNDQFNKAFDLFQNFELKGFKPDNYTFSILLKGIKNCQAPDLEFAESVVKMYLEHGNIVDLIILNSAIDVCMSHGDLERANRVFNLIKERTQYKADHVTYSTLIKGCCKNKAFETAMIYFNHMKVNDVKPNRIIYNSLMDLAVKDQKLKEALNLIEEMQKDEISADGYTYCIILNGLKLNESSETLVKLILENIKKVLNTNQFRLDEALFNTILDVCFKYDLLESLSYFYDVMKAKGITESPITFSTLIKAYSKQQNFEKVMEIFDKMLENRIALNDMTYGTLLDACAKINRMDFSLRIFDYLEALNSNMNSIIFTTMLKGYIRNDQFDEAVKFFNRVKKYVHLNGMIITYNCALDLYVRKADMDSCLKLFNELSTNFTPDIISYSTLIKGLTFNNRKTEAYEYVKKMVEIDSQLDVSVVNLFLDSCANPSDYKLGIDAYQYVMMKNINPNEITFGIMIKIFGFAKELHRAFDLLDLMAAYEISPSIVIYTNLIHVSFYNKNPKKADIAFTLFKKTGMKGDRLMYSKLIDGFIRFKEHNRVVKYIDLALKDNCPLKQTTMDELFNYFHGEDEMISKLNQLKSIVYVENTANNDEKIKRMEVKKAQMKAKNKALFDNNRNANNNNQVHSDVKNDDSKPKRMIKVNEVKKDNNNNNSKQFKPTEGAKQQNGIKFDNTKKPLGLFNFRTKN